MTLLTIAIMAAVAVVVVAHCAAVVTRPNP